MKRKLQTSALTTLTILSLLSYLYLQQQSTSLTAADLQLNEQEESFGGVKDVGLPDLLILKRVVEQAKRVLPASL